MTARKARTRRLAVVGVGVAAVLLQCATAADAVLVSPTGAPSTADTLLVKKDSSLTTYAGRADETSDTSQAPVDVTVSFP